MEIEEGCSSSTAEQLPESFKVAQESQISPSVKEFVYSQALSSSRKIRKKRNPSPSLPRRKTVFTYDHTMPFMRDYTASETSSENQSIPVSDDLYDNQK